MNDLAIAPHEHGVLRLFALDMRPQEAKFLREPGAVDQVLGVQGLDPAQIDIFPVSDLEDLGLFGYLSEGCGVSEDQLDRNHAAGHRWLGHGAAQRSVSGPVGDAVA